MLKQTHSKRLIRFGVASAATVVLACTADTMMAPGKPQLDIGPAAQVVTTIITPVPVLVVHSPATIVGTYPVGKAVFGPPLTAEGVTGDVIVALDAADALGPTPRDACSPLTNAAAVSGKVAMVERGSCLFVTKVKHAQEAGAIAVIVANNVAGPPGGMAGDDPTITISSAMISLEDAGLIRSALLTDVVNVTLQGPVADEEPPVLTVPVNVTANAVSPAGAMAAYSVTVSDNFDPNPVLSCLPSSGTLFSIGATTVTCTATDAAGNTASASFLVTIQGADDQIGALIDVVDELHLPPGTSTSLEQKLGAALSALASGQQNAACGQLKALINELNAQAGKKLTMEEAAILIGHAERIRSVLACLTATGASFVITGIHGIESFLEKCPTNDPAYAQITQDFQLLSDGQPIVSPVTCTEPISALPIDQLTDELIAQQVLRTAYYMSVGTQGKLPWTDKSLYAWMSSTVAGIDLKSAPGQLFCCEIINGKRYFVASRQDAFNRDFKRTWIGISSSLNFYAHEIRHADPGAPGHTNGCPAFPLPSDPVGCDATYDLTNLGSFGVQYWLESSWATGYLNIGIGCSSFATAMEYATWDANSANLFRTRFVTNAPPLVTAPQPYGGPCL